jgi:hypothetical protein
MTATVARLVLAMLLLPVSGVLFVILFAALLTSGGPGPPPVGRVLLVWGLVDLFIAAYWVLLWRGVVRWDRRRVLWTAGGTLMALLGGVSFALLCAAINPRLPAPLLALAGGAVVPIAWVLVTVLLWRETPHERFERLAGLGLEKSVSCPICGYSLAGLREARCPECGTHFTLDQLLASQSPVAESVAAPSSDP